MTDAAVPTAKLGLGAVVGGTFGVIRRNFATYLALVVMLLGAPVLLIGAGHLQIEGGAPLAGIAQMLLGYPLLLLTYNLMQAGLIHAAVADLNGRRASIAECLRAGLRHMLPLVAISILFVLGTGFGLVLLIVPGIMIGLAWYVAAPAQVVERAGVFGAFSRSGKLTKDNRWRILGLAVLWTITSSVLQGTLTNLTAMAGPLTAAGGGAATFGPVGLLVLSVTTVINTMVGAAGVAVIYYELRRVKEGVGPEALASVFD